MATADEIVDWLHEHKAIRSGESSWTTISDDEDVVLIDWKRMFPSERPLGRGNYDWKIDGDDWDSTEQLIPDARTDTFDTEIRDAIESDPPSERDGRETAEALGWDTCAWYQPMHFFGHDWGIFIRRDCIRKNTILIARFLPKGTPFSFALRKALTRGGFAALFLHEQFHHKIESLGIRLHVVEQSSRYLRYEDKVYRATYGSNDNLEEALANADAFLRVNTHPYSTWMGTTVVSALRDYLYWRYPYDPPGYQKAVEYLGINAFDNGVDLLHGQVQEAVLKPVRRVEDWAVATRLHQSLFKVSDHLWEVVPKKNPKPILPTVKPHKSISSRELVKLAKRLGWQIKDDAGKGSHIFMEKLNGPSLTIPGNRRDVSPGVLKSTLKALNPTYRLRDLPTLLNGL
jgi:predicted RNA binding protein YcfA (HicA-like mRNA interferase family)